MKRILTPLAILGLLAAGLTAHSQVTIPPSYAAPAGSVDTSKPGFRVRLKQSAVDVATTVAAREAHLLDASANVANLDDESYPKIGDDVWVLPVLNCNIDTRIYADPPTVGNIGNIQPDAHFPGIPNADVRTVQFTCEISGYLHLTAGAYRLVFNSDDGFRMTIGVGLNNRDLFAGQIGIFDGGRGASNSNMDIVVEEEGYYPFRIVYFQGGGGGSMEFTRFVDDRYVLVNGDDPDAPKVYYEATGPEAPVYAVASYPAPRSTNQQQQPEIWVELAGNVDSTKSALSLNGVELSPVTTEVAGDNVRISAMVPELLAAGSVNEAVVTFGDDEDYTVTLPWRFTVGAVATLPASYRETGTPGAAGFATRMHQADAVNAEGTAQIGLPATTARAEQQIRGFLIDPRTSAPYANVATATMTATPGVINLNVNANVNPPDEADQNGNFNRDNGYEDAGYPGLPGATSFAESQTWNFAIEFVAYLDLPAGPITLGVNSDDGFIVRSGPNPWDITAMTLGGFDGGRGSSDTLFNVYAEEAGLYPVRLLQYQGTGGGNVEFFSMLPNGTRVLINDLVAEAVPAYQTVDSAIPSVSIDRLLPVPNSIGNSKTSLIEAKLGDAVGGPMVNPASIVLELNGEVVTRTLSKIGPVTTVSHTPAPMPLGAVTVCTLTFSDMAGMEYEVEWAFEVGGEVRMRIFGGTDVGDPIGGGAVSDLTNSAQFRENRPHINRLVTAWEINPWNRADNYGSEFLGYFVPRTTDYHTFYLSSDDGSQLWLSTDDSPVNARIIASQASWNGRLQWISGNNTATRKSAEIMLEAGQPYFIRTLHKEGGGGDNLEVTYRTRSNPAIANNAPAMTRELRPFDELGVSPVPVGGTVLQGRPWTFSGGYVAGLSGPITYQWLKDGEEIEGADQPTYTIASTTLADAGEYVLRVSLASEPPLTATSPAATLTVDPDDVPPVLISGGYLPMARGGAVGLLFSETVDIEGATFTVEGATVSSAVLMEHTPRVVRLNITATPQPGYQITVEDVRDLAGNSLTTTIVGAITDLRSQDIIRARDAEGVVTDPIRPGNALALGEDAYYVAGGGSDIWDAADGCHYLYRQYTGAFDIRTRIQSLAGTHQWAKANLMARESLDGNSRQVNAMATRSDGNGQNNFGIQWRDTTGGGSGGVNPVTIRDNADYPNAWLRLVREGDTSNLFRAYWSNNGVTWNLLGEHEVPTSGGVLPATLFVGMGVTSHDNGPTVRLAEAVYRDFTLAEFIPLPLITTQPQAAVTAILGEGLTLAVSATGPEPMTYQWMKDGVDIEGAVFATLTFIAVQEADAATYAVKVTGPGGTTTSNNSVVTVVELPTVTLWDIVVATENLSTLKAAIESVGLEGALQGTDLLTVFAPTDEAFAALPEGTLEALTPEELAGVLTYHAVAGRNLAGSLTPGAYPTLLAGFSVNVTTPPGMVMVNDATVIEADVLAANGVAHVIDKVLLPPPPAPPEIVTQPEPAVEAFVGEAVTLTVVATGHEPLSYQWTKDGADIEGATGATLVLDNAQLSDSGVYAVRVTNPVDTVTSNDSVVTITEPPPLTAYNIAWVSFHPADDSPTVAAGDAGFTQAPDVGYTDLLREAGHNVTRIVSSNNPNPGVLNKFDLIMISRSVPSDHYVNVGATRWNSIQTPMIVMGGYVLRQNRMGYTIGNIIPDTDRTVSLSVNAPEHPVFAGIGLDAANTMVNPFAGIVTFGELVQRGISVNTDAVAGDGTVLAVIDTEGDPANNGMVIGEWLAGATMGNAAIDTLAGHRLVFLSGSREQGITSQAAGIYDLTEDGARMLLNAVGYMAEPKTVFEQPVIEDGNITINWAGDGELETATDIHGVWTGTGNTSGSFTEPIGDGNKYYRINRGE